MKINIFILLTSILVIGVCDALIIRTLGGDIIIVAIAILSLMTIGPLGVGSVLHNLVKKKWPRQALVRIIAFVLFPAIAVFYYIHGFLVWEDIGDAGGLLAIQTGTCACSLVFYLCLKREKQTDREASSRVNPSSN